MSASTPKPEPHPEHDYDAMDRIVQDLVNIESFYTYLAMNPKDLGYMNAHLSAILGLRRTISRQLDMLADEPYSYPKSKLQKLHQENEKIFSYLEGAVGAMDPWNEKLFKSSLHALEETFSKFDDELTP